MTTTFNPADWANRPVATRQANKTQYYNYDSVVLRPIQGVWQLWDIKEVVDEKNGDAKYGYKKIAYDFIHIIPGAEAAMNASEDEQNKWRAKGHGKRLRIKVNPLCSPPRPNPTDPTKSLRSSSMYELHCILLNDGEPLSDEQLGRVSDSEALKWAAEYNKGQSADRQIAGVETARAYYAAFHLVDTLETLKASKPKVYATPGVVTSKATGEKFNVLDKVDALVPADAGVPDFRYFPRPTDPREAQDDPSVKCGVCASTIRGYENNKGEWVSNTQAATAATERYGQPMCGKCIAAHKRGGEALPF